MSSKPMVVSEVLTASTMGPWISARMNDGYVLACAPVFTSRRVPGDELFMGVGGGGEGSTGTGGGSWPGGGGGRGGIPIDHFLVVMMLNQAALAL